MTGAELNKIMRACAPVVDTKNLRDVMRYIEIQCDGQGTGCATALDGFTLSQTTFPCQGDAGKLLVSPHDKVDKDAEVELHAHGEQTTLKVGDTQRIEKTPPVGTFIDHARLMRQAMDKQRTITIALNPARLKQVIKSHKSEDEMITLHIYSPSDTVIVQSQNVVGMMCPVLHADGNMEPEFWSKECKEAETNDAMDTTASR